MPMKLRAALPEFPAGGTWVNGPGPAAEPSGGPTLVHFWAAGCRLSRAGLPLVNRWRESYGARCGLRVIGVHRARPGFEEDAADGEEAARSAIAGYALKHPVLLGCGPETARAFRNDCVPAYYLFDRAGRLRHFQSGDRGLGILEQRIRKVGGAEASNSHR